MMDSQENILQAEQNTTPAEPQETKEVEKVEEQLPAAEEPQAEEASQVETQQVEERKVYQSKKEVLDRIKEIAHGEEVPQKDEVDYLKTVFYKLHIAEREAKLKEYLEAGGDPETYQVTPDEDEEVFKAEMGVVKERRQPVKDRQQWLQNHWNHYMSHRR